MARLQNFGFTTGSGKQLPLADTCILFSSSPTFSYSQTVCCPHSSPIFHLWKIQFFISSEVGWKLVLVFTQPHSHCILSKSPQIRKDGYTSRLLCSNTASSCLKNNGFIKVDIAEESHVFTYNTGNSAQSPKSVPQITETHNCNYMAFSGWSKASWSYKIPQ